MLYWDKEDYGAFYEHLKAKLLAQAVSPLAWKMFGTV
jgi:hypothetical protein